MKVGIDLMGSDSSPVDLFDAVLSSTKNLLNGAMFTIFMTKESHSKLHPTQKEQLAKFEKVIDFHFVQEVIEMHDDPLLAIRKKRDSSIVQGIKALKRKKIDAFVSSGNTGALVAYSTLTLNPLPTIRRPALLAALPTLNRHISVLDVGGNTSYKPQDLVRFAKLGIAYERAYFKLNSPRVGLLNIGQESKKGTSALRETHALLSQEPIQFVGNVEGRDIFHDKVDVLVTDGFTGNILLKTTEGAAAFLLDYLAHSSHATPALMQELKQKFSYREYPGAILLGVDGIVIKCHGDSSKDSLEKGIKAAIAHVESNVIDHLKASLS